MPLASQALIDAVRKATDLAAQLNYQVEPFAAGSGPLEVPGRLVPVPTPGHTSGLCAFHLPERGVLIAGDAR